MERLQDRKRGSLIKGGARSRPEDLIRRADATLKNFIGSRICISCLETTYYYRSNHDPKNITPTLQGTGLEQTIGASEPDLEIPIPTCECSLRPSIEAAGSKTILRYRTRGKRRER
jgi:hypothetical protein